MTGFALAAMLQLSAISADASYATAHRAMMETGKPMVLLIGADWCPACRTMKDQIVPDVARHGGFDVCLRDAPRDAGAFHRCECDALVLGGISCRGRRPQARAGQRGEGELAAAGARLRCRRGLRRRRAEL